MTTSSNDPDVLRAEIEQTRARLSQDVNALGEAVTPSNIARRQVDKAKGAAVGIKDKVMGSAEDAAASVGDRASSLREKVPGGGSGGGSGGSSGGGVMTGVTDSMQGMTSTVSNAPQAAKSRAQGNPLAAGMIAMGAGWLLGSLLPASAKEREAASRVKEQAKPLMQEAQGLAKETAQNLKEPAIQAADSVKSTAQDAAQTVKAEGQQAAQDVKSSAQESKGSVQSHQSSPSTSL